MKWNVGTKIGIGFGIVLTIFVIVGAVAYRSVVRQTDTANAVTHTYAVENELTQLLSSLQDAETGQRGYLISGSDSYLAPYTAALPAIEQQRTEGWPTSLRTTPASRLISMRWSRSSP